MMSEISNTILSTEEGKEKYDATLKELLANKQFLSRILKRFVSEFTGYPLEDIEKKYIEADSISVSKPGVERNRTNIDGISNEDKTSAVGRQTMILMDCNIDGGILAKFDADGEYLDEDMDFTFEDFKMPEAFKDLEGFLTN